MLRAAFLAMGTFLANKYECDVIKVIVMKVNRDPCCWRILLTAILALLSE